MKSSIVLCYEINKLAHLFTYLITYPLTFSTDCVSLWGGGDSFDHSDVSMWVVAGDSGWVQAE